MSDLNKLPPKEKIEMLKELIPDKFVIPVTNYYAISKNALIIYLTKYFQKDGGQK